MRAPVLALVLTAILAGCGGSSTAKKLPAAPPPPQQKEQGFAKIATQGPEVFGTAKPPAPGQADTSWSIVIVSVRGEGMQATVQEALEKVRTKGGVPGAYVEPRGQAMVVAYGKYADPTSKQAQEDLKRIQGLVIDGGTPFAGAILAPPPFDAMPGSIPEYDLSTVKQRLGKNALYTLQVAAYARMDGKPPSDKDLSEFRAAAEKAAVEFRREGEEAYYHHGRTMSVVSIGVFGPKDVEFVHKTKQDTGAWNESAAVMAVKSRHPLNLVNGAELKVRTRGQAEAKAQPSMIIAIPN